MNYYTYRCEVGQAEDEIHHVLRLEPGRSPWATRN